MTYLWILIASVIIFTTYAVYITETLTESGIETPFDSVWFTLVTVFAGYYDYCVKSLGGRMAALVQLLIGMALLSMITGKVASVFMNMQMKNDKGLRKLKKMNGHFLLLGWRPGFDKILDTVLNSNPDITPDMIVLVNDAPSEQIEQLRFHKVVKIVPYSDKIKFFGSRKLVKKSVAYSARRHFKRFARLFFFFNINFFNETGNIPFFAKLSDKISVSVRSAVSCAVVYMRRGDFSLVKIFEQPEQGNRIPAARNGGKNGSALQPALSFSGSLKFFSETCCLSVHTFTIKNPAVRRDVIAFPTGSKILPPTHV